MRIGDYNLVERIGAAGMGEVWCAENAHTRVACAVKLLPDDATDDCGFVARFFDEGRVMQTLDHPNIVRVHHVGHDASAGPGQAGRYEPAFRRGLVAPAILGA